MTSWVFFSGRPAGHTCGLWRSPIPPNTHNDDKHGDYNITFSTIIIITFTIIITIIITLSSIPKAFLNSLNSSFFSWSSRKLVGKHDYNDHHHHHHRHLTSSSPHWKLPLISLFLSNPRTGQAQIPDFHGNHDYHDDYDYHVLWFIMIIIKTWTILPPVMMGRPVLMLKQTLKLW